LGRRFGQLPV